MTSISSGRKDPAHRPFEPDGAGEEAALRRLPWLHIGGRSEGVEEDVEVGAGREAVVDAEAVELAAPVVAVGVRSLAGHHGEHALARGGGP
jgi:hypothetical protein